MFCFIFLVSIGSYPKPLARNLKEHASKLVKVYQIGNKYILNHSLDSPLLQLLLHH